MAYIITIKYQIGDKAYYHNQAVGRECLDAWESSDFHSLYQSIPTLPGKIIGIIGVSGTALRPDGFAHNVYSKETA